MAHSAHPNDGLPTNDHLQICLRLDELRVNGINGFQDRKPYVPYQDLKKFWDGPAIRRVLNEVGPLYLSVKVIQEQYLGVFSTLVYANKVAFLPFFTGYALSDEHWPDAETSSLWKNNPTCEAFLSCFNRYKWTFFPFEFHRNNLTNNELPLERILPIDDSEEDTRHVIGANSAGITKITLNKSYNKLDTDDRGNEFILKSYRLKEPEQARAYDREYKAYTVLQSAGFSPHIVRFYGSFRQGENGHLLLELVKGETLKGFLKRNNPQTPSDIFQFWTSIRGIFSGLNKIHQMATDCQSHEAFKAVIHQDLTLDNILITEKPDCSSAYRFIVKLVDFERSSIVDVIPGQEEPSSPDYWGTPTITSPEASHHLHEFEQGPSSVNRASDVWSLGCVTSMLAAWVAGGPDLLETTRKMRADELSANTNFAGSAYTHGFHQGSDVTQAVLASHLIIRDYLVDNAQDKITPAILDIVERDMLVADPFGRSQVKQIYCAFLNVIDQHKAGEDIKIQPGPRETSHTRDLSRGASPKSLSITVQDVLDYRDAKKSNGKVEVDPRVDQIIDHLVKNLGPRDHLFFIDNSPSMKAHKKDLERVFTALSYIAKQIDTNGIEQAFASSPTNIHQHKNTSELIRSIKNVKYDQEAGMMEDKLQKFIDKAVKPKLLGRYGLGLHRDIKPLSIIVLTDGCWGENLTNGAGVETPINRLVSFMEEKRIARTDVMVQFLRFGNDRHGMKYLEHLDDMKGDQSCDIVDTKSIDDDVCSMFFGSISLENDGRKSLYSDR